MKSIIAFFVGLLCCCGRADAQSVRLKEFLHPKPEFKPMDKAFAAGVKEGLMAYNAFVTKNGRPLFCMPGDLALTATQAEEIMMRWVEKK